MTIRFDDVPGEMVNCGPDPIDYGELDPFDPDDFETTGEAPTREIERLPRLCLNDVLSSPRPETPWVYPGWIARGDRVLIIGSKKEGKSTLLTDLAVSIASGTNWLGFNSTSEGETVVYVDAEQPEVLARQRLYDLGGGRQWSQETSDKAARNLHYFRCPLNLDNAKRVEMLRNELQLSGAKWLLVDSLKRVHSRVENDNDEMEKFLTGVVDPLLADFPGLTVVMLHHVRKGELTEENIVDAARGAGVIGDWAESMLGYLKEGEDRKLFVACSRWKSRAAPVIVRLVEGDAGDRLEGAVVRTEATDKLDRHLEVVGSAGCSRAHLIEHVEESCDLAESAAKKAVTRYIRTGRSTGTIATKGLRPMRVWRAKDAPK